MKDIKDILDNPAPNAMDFLAQINLNVLSKSIYVFTTKGELTQLPKEATALDFAFTIHTDIGIHAEAARIDHELKPLNTTLENGQQVEIITSDKEMVTKEWFNWVTTTKARAKIRGWLRTNMKIDPTSLEAPKKKGMFSNLIGIDTKKKKKKVQPPKEEYIPRSTTIELSGIDAQGLLNTITHVIGEICSCNIVNIHIESKDGLFKGYITFNTGDTKVVNKICTELKKVHGIDKAHIKNK
jgi:(p)ppGpp synthase/HD superfamily hydrolase